MSLYSDMSSAEYNYHAEKYGVDPGWLMEYLYKRDDFYKNHWYKVRHEWVLNDEFLIKESDWIDRNKQKNDTIQKISRVGINILQWMFFGPIIYIILAYLSPVLPLLSIVCFLIGLYHYAEKWKRNESWEYAAILMIAFVVTFPFFYFVIYAESCKC